MTDLFKTLTMRDRVLAFIKDKHYASSIDLDNFKSYIQKTEGNVPGILRIHREARNLVRTEYKNGVLITINIDGVLHRLSKEEKIFRFNVNPKIAVYQYVGKI